MSFYPADLARIHDEGFGDFARAAVCELLERLPGSGHVVELGCGTGISAELLTGAGYEVTGIDISADMLDIARGRAPRARFLRASLWDAELPPCDAVTAIGEVVNYRADERAGAERLPELLGRIHAALRPGGLLLFDFATPGRGGRPPHVARGDGWHMVSEAIEDPSTATLERHMTIEAGGATRDEVHRLALYEPEAVLKCLEGLGFRSEALDGYCEFGFWPGYAAFAAVKPS